MRISENDNAKTEGAAAPYLAGPLREVTGNAIRPGGLSLTERGVRFCAFPPGARILDVGCGAGGTVEYLSERFDLAVCGVDPEPALIGEALTRSPRLSVAVAAAEALPFDDATCDGVLCECVLSLVREPRATLAEFYRVLRPGGCLMISDLYSRSDRCATPSSSLARRGEIELWVEDAGFSLSLWEDHTVLLKELAARLILAGGSLSDFCSCAGGEERAGYFLLVARK